MPAQAPYELPAQRLVLGYGTHSSGTGIARDQQADERAASGGASTVAGRLRQPRRYASHMSGLQPKQRPKQPEQRKALPMGA